MRGWILPGIIFIILVLTGCNGSQEEKKASANMKDVTTSIAYNDHFTKKFIDIKKEVNEGYYSYNSMTDGYTMLFPADAKMIKDEFAVNANIFEQYHFVIDDKKDKKVDNYRVTYENRSITSDIKLNLDILSNSAGYNGEFKEYQHEGNTYYFAKNVIDNEGKTNYQYLSYIKSNYGDQSVSYYLNSSCSDSEESCKIDPKKLEKEFKLMIESVEFSE